MKHTVISLILLGLMLLFSLWSSHSVTTAVDETYGLLAQAMEQEQLGSDHNAARLVQAAGVSWKRHEILFGTVLRHDEIDEVMTTLFGLYSFAQSGEQEEFLSDCASLLARLQHIRDMEKPDFHNIM